jgi:hypothetical protein
VVGLVHPLPEGDRVVTQILVYYGLRRKKKKELWVGFEKPTEERIVGLVQWIEQFPGHTKKRITESRQQITVEQAFHPVIVRAAKTRLDGHSSYFRLHHSFIL